MRRKMPGFKRPTGTRRIRTLFVLAVEGSKTERQYFDIFKDNRLVSMKYLTKPKGTDPLSVLKRMKRHLVRENLKAGDMAWIVMDMDEWLDEQLIRLHHWAQEHSNHGFVLSNPNFEYWLLLHFEDGDGISSSKSCTARLRRYLPHYRKTIDAGKISPEQIEKAIQRAKQRDTPPCADWPRTLGGTTVYRLVEKILEASGPG